MSNPLSGRVALVTGASRGIGGALARRLASDGAHVIALARTQGALEELDDDITSAGGSVTLVPADITDYPAIDRLGAAIHARWGKLDIALGNAGVLGGLRPLGHVEPKVWDNVMAVNLTANWRLIRSLDPLLRAADQARALFVTSAAAHMLRAYWGPYAVSKAGLEALAKTYAAECSETSVTVNLINPGPVRTRMRAQAMPGEDPTDLPDPDDVAAAIADLCASPEMSNGRAYDFADGRLSQRTNQ